MDDQIRNLFYQTYLLANDLAKKAQKVYRFERSADTTDGVTIEITKNISIRTIAPLALFTVRATGTAELAFPEVLLDFDFPGHYFRRIKTVNLTVTGTTNMGADLNTTLTLLEHRYWELEFNDFKRYVPFEGAGALSKWRIELPMPVKQFDYNTISDIVLQIKYMANAGGARFCRAAAEASRYFQNTVSG
ncbi:MAG: hypothetical protein Q9166_008005 [cf. Caloplaca sp. 2 TL-2023]